MLVLHPGPFELDLSDTTATGEFDAVFPFDLAKSAGEMSSVRMTSEFCRLEIGRVTRRDASAHAALRQVRGAFLQVLEDQPPHRLRQLRPRGFG